MRRALPILLAVAATALAACGGDDDSRDSSRVRGDTLTIYASLPEHGLEAAAGDAAAAGMRAALIESRRRAGGKAVRFARFAG